VNEKSAGDKVKLREPGKVTVKARVAFAADAPLGTANGGKLPDSKTRLVEVIVNGMVIATQVVPADDKEHELTFFVPIEKSSWIAVRHFPQMHTNPVDVIVADLPIRASRKSALWAIGTIEQLWRVRAGVIAAEERAEAERVFQWAIQRYQKIAEESPPGS
jgi:hypothetical protein